MKLKFFVDITTDNSFSFQNSLINENFASYLIIFLKPGKVYAMKLMNF
jgi:hypothetical protein